MITSFLSKVPLRVETSLSPPRPTTSANLLHLLLVRFSLPARVVARGSPWPGPLSSSPSSPAVAVWISPERNFARQAFFLHFSLNRTYPSQLNYLSWSKYCCTGHRFFIGTDFFLADELSRAASVVVDTGLHSKAWTVNQALAYLNTHTFLLQSEIDNLVDFILAHPGKLTFSNLVSFLHPHELCFRLKRVSCSWLSTPSQGLIFSIFGHFLMNNPVKTAQHSMGRH